MEKQERNRSFTENKKEIDNIINYLWISTYSSIFVVLRQNEAEFKMLCYEILVKGIDGYNSETSSIKTYVTKVLRNKLNSHIRDMNRQKRKITIEAASLDEMIADSEGIKIEDTLKLDFCLESELESENSSKLIEAVGRNKRERKILLFLSEGYSEKYIAENLGIEEKLLREIIRSFATRPEMLRQISKINK